MDNYDLVVIGAGPGGYVAALKAAQLGLSVAVIERRELGGTCLNRGCIPTKTLLHTALLYQEAKNFAELGLEFGSLCCNLVKMQERKETVVATLQVGIRQLFQGSKIRLYEGTGTIISDHQVTVALAEGEEIIGADKILIATGSVPVKPPIPGIDSANILDSDQLLVLPELPKRLIIIGGGVIGVEFATVFSALGCEVTIIEAMPRILPNMDKEISQNLTMLLKKDGVKIYTGATVDRLSETEGVVGCQFTYKEQTETLSAERVLVAVGRRANTTGLFGQDFGLDMERGTIVVNEQFQTSVESIYAIGDVIKGIQLAHLASAQGTVVAELAAGHSPSIRLDIVPSCIYTNPEIAAVGLTADEAKAAGIAIKTGKYLMSGNGKSLIEQQKRGFIKLVFAEDSAVLLGAQLMCARATDLIGEMTTAIVNGLTISQLSATIRAHPTFGEGLGEAIDDAAGCAIHSRARR